MRVQFFFFYITELEYLQVLRILLKYVIVHRRQTDELTAPFCHFLKYLKS